MSQFLSSKLLKYRAMREADPINRDLACRNCGYNVRGLRYGRNCPECGSMIELFTPLRDVLLEGGADQRNRWRMGLLLAAAVIAIFVFARLGFFFGSLGRIGPLPDEPVYIILCAINALLWVAAVWMLTPAELGEKWKWMRGVRALVRILTAFWIVAYACAAARVLGGGNVTAIAVAEILGRLMGGVGALVLFFMLAWIAGESELEMAAKRLTSAIWFVPILTAVQMLLPLIPWVSFRSLGIVIMLPLGLIIAWIWAMSLSVRGMLEMAEHIRWAQRHAIDFADREARIDAQRRTYEQSVTARIRPLPGRDEREVQIDS